MTKFITTLLNGSSSPFSIAPKTNYQKNATQSAQQLFKDNWFKTGNSLRSAYAPRESNGVSISKLHLGKEIPRIFKKQGHQSSV